jgi:3-isopropylmalate dehydrogenase
MRIVCLPGDGIGPEVMTEAVRALIVLVPGIELEERAIGTLAIAQSGDPLPPETLAACKSSDAVLMGAVGAADYSWGEALNPEEGMFRLRRELDVYANLRPFKRDDGVDALIVRELVAGLYFGARGTRDDGTVFDTCEYHPDQVERVIRVAFELARERGGRLTSVDKANVMATSRMWRAAANRVANDYPDVDLDHLLADTAAMHLARDPGRFDVLVMENTFGDILSDVAAAVCGGLEVAASACVGDSRPGLFEPVHGTAPDIAGLGIASPAAMMYSAALMLHHGLDMRAEADLLAAAVKATVDDGAAYGADAPMPTREFGDRVERRLREALEGGDLRVPAGEAM